MPRMLLLMVRDLYKHLGLRSPEIDPDLVADMIWEGNFWAGPVALPGVFGPNSAKDPTLVSYVVDVLDMWLFLERAHANLTDAEKVMVDGSAAVENYPLQFPGFDGNNESDERSIALFFINKLSRFPSYAGRELNSHFPT